MLIAYFGNVFLQAVALLSDSRFLYFVSAAGLFCLSISIWLYLSPMTIKDAPYLSSAPRRWNGLPRSFMEYIEEGYRNFPDGCFSVPTDSGPLVILPPTSLEEIKALPETMCSFRKSFEFWFLNEHTGVGGDDEHQMALIQAARLHLTKHSQLTKLLAGLQDELDYALRVEKLPFVGQNDFTPIAIYPVMIRIVARLIARVWVGPDLCRNEEYLESSISFTLNCLKTSRILAWVPQPLRPLVKYALPGYHGMRRQEALTARLIAPIVERRRRHEEAGGEAKAAKPDDMLQWLMDACPLDKADDDMYLAISLVNASLAATHSTAIVATNAVFDLASRPGYLQPLREELAESLGDAPGNFGPALDIGILNLHKLDSFLKESQRLNPLGLIGLMRSATRPIQLSNGIRIPKHTQMAFAMRSMSHDPAVFDSAASFDGLRFSRLREERSGSEAADSWQFTASNNWSYSFGGGAHSCPGRHFAALELKLLLANLLWRFDLRVEGGGAMEYRTGVRGFMFVPDPTKLIMMRHRARDPAEVLKSGPSKAVWT